MNKGENSQFMVLKVHLDTCIDKKKKKKNSHTHTTMFKIKILHSLWNKPSWPRSSPILNLFPQPPHITDHCPFCCIPIKSRSLMATVHSRHSDPTPPPIGSTGQDKADHSLLWTHCNGLQRGMRSVWPTLSDWCWPDLSSGLSKMFWGTISSICPFSYPYLPPP